MLDEKSQAISDNGQQAASRRGRPKGSPNKIKKNPNKDRLDRLVRMSAEDFTQTYPLADPYLKAFISVARSAGLPVTGTHLTKSRVAALEIADDGPELYPLDRVTSCIRWCFSEAKRSHSWWYRIPVSNLGTVLTIYPGWLQDRGFTNQIDPGHQPDAEVQSDKDRSGLSKFNFGE